MKVKDVWLGVEPGLTPPEQSNGEEIARLLFDHEKAVEREISEKGCRPRSAPGRSTECLGPTWPRSTGEKPRAEIVKLATSTE